MKSLTDDVETLRAIPLFAGITPARLKLLAFTCDRVAFRPNQRLICEGEKSAAAFVILSGTADVVRTVDGVAEKKGEVHACAVVGEPCLMSDRVHEVTVVATSLVETLRIDRQRFRDLLASCPQTMSQVMRAMSDRMVRVH